MYACIFETWKCEIFLCVRVRCFSFFLSPFPFRTSTLLLLFGYCSWFFFFSFSFLLQHHFVFFLSSSSSLCRYFYLRIHPIITKIVKKTAFFLFLSLFLFCYTVWKQVNNAKKHCHETCFFLSPSYMCR